MATISSFLASLLPGVRHFRDVSLCLADFESGVNLTYLKDVIHRLDMSGCATFWLYSSYLSLPATHDIPEAAVRDVLRPFTPDVSNERKANSSMERLLIQSASVFSSSILPWFIRTLEAGTALTCIDVLAVGLSTSRWSVILAGVHLPRLASFRIAGINLATLADFLSRHTCISTVKLDGLVLDRALASEGGLYLPCLHTVEGNEHQIAHFLHLLVAIPLLHLVNVEFRADRLTEDTERGFDSEAHIHALRRLSLLQANKFLTMSFDVPPLRNFTVPFLDRKDGIHPESSLSVNTLDLCFVHSSREDIVETMVRVVVECTDVR